MDNRKKRLLMLLLLVLGCIVTSVLGSSEMKKEHYLEKTSHVADKSAERESQQKNAVAGQMLVHISGAVNAPGVYSLPVGVRADTAIAMAGGSADEADTERVNLARKLKDGAQIYIPFRKNSKAKKASANTEKLGLDGSVPNETKSANNRHNPTINREIVNLNTATQAELEVLPGIGPAMAQRIIAQRQTAAYKTVDDLIRVRGIGKAKIEKLRPYVKTD